MRHYANNWDLQIDRSCVKISTLQYQSLEAQLLTKKDRIITIAFEGFYVRYSGVMLGSIEKCCNGESYYITRSVAFGEDQDLYLFPLCENDGSPVDANAFYLNQLRF